MRGEQEFLNNGPSQMTLLETLANETPLGILLPKIGIGGWYMNIFWFAKEVKNVGRLHNTVAQGARVPSEWILQRSVVSLTSSGWDANHRGALSTMRTSRSNARMSERFAESVLRARDWVCKIKL